MLQADARGAFAISVLLLIVVILTAPFLH